MVKRILIVVNVGLLVAVLLLASAVVRLENFHYASMVGFCRDFPPDQLIQMHDCLHSQQTRTSSAWHLYYALTSER